MGEYRKRRNEEKRKRRDGIVEKYERRESRERGETGE